MKFSREVYQYLHGEKFSNSLEVKISEREKSIFYRLEMLENFAKGKRIIHVGFADHIPLIKSKIEKNTWLHQRLVKSSEICVGVDIDPDAVNFVKNEFQYENIYCFDITDRKQIPGEILNQSWDYLILGEVLEHIDNPVAFLKVINQNFEGIAKNLIVTVPNAWDSINIQMLRRNTELINSDHRYWFTPYTLAKVGLSAGLKPSSFFYVQNYLTGNIWKRFLLKKYPATRETVLMIFDISG
jgi:hypothetical protein